MVRLNRKDFGKESAWHTAERLLKLDLMSSGSTGPVISAQDAQAGPWVPPRPEQLGQMIRRCQHFVITTNLSIIDDGQHVRAWQDFVPALLARLTHDCLMVKRRCASLQDQFHDAEMPKSMPMTRPAPDQRRARNRSRAFSFENAGPGRRSDASLRDPVCFPSLKELKSKFNLV
jgi:hypothetical protein